MTRILHYQLKQCHSFLHITVHRPSLRFTADSDHYQFKVFPCSLVSSLLASICRTSPSFPTLTIDIWWWARKNFYSPISIQKSFCSNHLGWQSWTCLLPRGCSTLEQSETPLFPEPSCYWAGLLQLLFLVCNSELPHGCLCTPSRNFWATWQQL